MNQLNQTTVTPVQTPQGQVVVLKKITQKERQNFIKAKLQSDSRWAIRALEIVYSRQTDSEKNMQQTVEDNGVGFTGIDAEILTSFGNQVKQGRTLSNKQLAILMRKMHKYWKQVLSVMDMSKLETLMRRV